MNWLWIILSILFSIIAVGSAVIEILFIFQLIRKQGPVPRFPVIAMWFCAAIAFAAGAYLVSRLIS